MDNSPDMPPVLTRDGGEGQHVGAASTSSSTAWGSAPPVARRSVRAGPRPQGSGESDQMVLMAPEEIGGGGPPAVLDGEQSLLHLEHHVQQLDRGPRSMERPSDLEGES